MAGWDDLLGGRTDFYGPVDVRAKLCVNTQVGGAAHAGVSDLDLGDVLIAYTTDRKTARGNVGLRVGYQGLNGCVQGVGLYYGTRPLGNGEAHGGAMYDPLHPYYFELNLNPDLEVNSAVVQEFFWEMSDVPANGLAMGSATLSAYGFVSRTCFIVLLHGIASVVNGTTNGAGLHGVAGVGLDASCSFVPSDPLALDSLTVHGGPILANPSPSSTSGQFNFTGGRPAGLSFTNASAGDWLNMGFPFPSINGYRFHATDTNLFTAITNFPDYLTNTLEVWVEGTNFGSFRSGDTCSFAGLPNGGVESFELHWLGLLTGTNGSLAQMAVPLAFSSTNASLDVTFMAPPGPMFVLRPASVMFPRGMDAELAAPALSVGDVAFQWRHDSNNIAGATNATLHLTNVQPGTEGDYSVILTDTSGSTTGLVAHVTVSDQTVAVPLNVVQSGTNVIISWPATNSAGFTLQTTQNPSAADQWADSASAPVLWGSQYFLTNTVSSSARFYRLRKVLIPPN
jgi:hypothetical protein